MAKICPQCGLKHYKSARRCVNCDSKLQIIKRDLIISIAITMVSIALVISLALAIIIPILQSPETKLKKMLKAITNNDPKEVLTFYPDFYVNKLREEDPFFEVEFRENIKELSEYIFSFNIHDKARPSTSQRTDINKKLDTYVQYGYDVEKLEDIEMVWMEIRGGVRGLWNTFYEKYIMIKYNGEWYILP